MYPILIRFDQSFEKNLKSLCPKCTYEANPQQLTDIFAGKTPAAVVNISTRTRAPTGSCLTSVAGSPASPRRLST